MAGKTLEQEVLQLKKRLKLLEGEVRIFTPPITSLQREVVAFRTEVSQKFTEFRSEVNYKFTEFRNEVNQKFSEADQKLTTFRADVFERLHAVDLRFNEMDRKLDHLIEVLKESLSKD